MAFLTFKPLLAWPGPFTVDRRSSRFDSTYEQTIYLLENELASIWANNVVIQLAVKDSDIRRDNLPRSAAKPQHPGVILSFETEKGAFSMPCDTFFDWKDNLRGIALSLEALRKIDRYGVTKSGEQYRGWAALPPASSASEVEDFKTREEAIQWMATVADYPFSVLSASAGHRCIAYRDAAKKLHPDSGGDPAQFRKLQNAKKILGI